MEESKVMLAIREASDSLESKIDVKLDTQHRDAHGRMDRMEDTHAKQGKDILTEIKQSNLAVTMEFKAINMTSQEILIAQQNTNRTTEQLALKIDDTEEDLGKVKETQQSNMLTMTKATERQTIFMGISVTVASAIMAGTVMWLFSLITPNAPAIAEYAPPVPVVQRSNENNVRGSEQQ